MTTDQLIYLTGEPGSGKSTLMARLTAHWTRHPADGRPTRDLLIADDALCAIELGRRSEEGFSGTDRLSMTVVGAAEQWLLRHEAPPVLGEGARLGNARFLQAAVNAGYDVTLVLLEHADAPLWRAGRAERLGRTQNPSWVKGRGTACRRLADNPPAGVTVLRGSPDTLHSLLSRRIAE